VKPRPYDPGRSTEWPERWPVLGPALGALLGLGGMAIAIFDGDTVAGTIYSAFAITMGVVGARNHGITDGITP
jgi:hypothetical protein